MLLIQKYCQVHDSKSQTQDRYPLKRKGVVYCFPCRDCNKVYVRETGRKLEPRLKEHKRQCTLLQVDKSAIAEHAIREDHRRDFDACTILAVDG